MSDSHHFPHGPPETLYEVLAGVERVPQPFPEYVRGGDCFQCAAYAVLAHFARAKGTALPVTLREMYDRVWSHPDVGLKNGGSSMTEKEAFWKRWNALLDWHDLVVETVVDPPLDLGWPAVQHADFGPKLYTADSLARRLRVYLEAGYVAYVAIQKQPAREVVRAGHRPHGADHIVVVDGYRKSFQPDVSCWTDSDGSRNQTWSGAYAEEIHVVCSATPEPYWIRVRDFVEDHGGYHMRFIRPRRERASSWPEGHPACSQHP